MEFFWTTRGKVAELDRVVRDLAAEVKRLREEMEDFYDVTTRRTERARKRQAVDAAQAGIKATDVSLPSAPDQPLPRGVLARRTNGAISVQP